MLEKFVKQIHFTSTEDFAKHYHVEIPDNFNFGYDVVDEWARINPTKRAICWGNDQENTSISHLQTSKNRATVQLLIFSP